MFAETTAIQFPCANREWSLLLMTMSRPSYLPPRRQLQLTVLDTPFCCATPKAPKIVQPLTHRNTTWIP